MSDEDEFESEEDFSASEDEWTPNKHKEEHSDEEDVSSVDLEEDFAVSPPTKRKKDSNATKRHMGKKQQQKLKAPSLRDKMFKKYKPPPKTIIANKSVPSSSKYNEGDDNDSDSGSSVENCLVNPQKLDLKSSFFDVKSNKTENEEEVPNFDCNIGLESATAAIDEDEMQSEEDTSCKKNVKERTDISPFKQFYDYKNTIDKVNKTVKSIKSSSIANDKQDDISSLLALGEASTSITEENNQTKSKNRKQKIKNSDSEWEEVEEDENENEIAKTKDGIEITVGFDTTANRREKKVADEQAQLMRRLNRIIKENCLTFHKVSLLCQIARGSFVNRGLNNPSLMAVALKLLPSEKSYPNGRTCIKYFESIAKWYKATIQLKSDSVNSTLKKNPPLPISLALQINSKSAICKTDFVYIFIVLLRAMGIQCRLIINLTPLPIRPAADDLCSLKTKQTQDKKMTTNKEIKKDQSGKIEISPKKFNEESSNLKGKSGNNIPLNKELMQKKIPFNNQIKESKTKSDSKSKQKSDASQQISKNSIPKIKVLKADLEESKDSKLPYFSPIKTRTQRKLIPEIADSKQKIDVKNIPSTSKKVEKISKSRSPSPKFYISPKFVKVENQQTSPMKKNSRSTRSKATKANIENTETLNKNKTRNPSPKFSISPTFIQNPSTDKNNEKGTKKMSLRQKLKIPQLDGADGIDKGRKKKSLKEKIFCESSEDSDFEGFPSKLQKLELKDSNMSLNISQKSRPKLEPKILTTLKKDRRVLSTDDESVENKPNNATTEKKNTMNVWVEVYSETEDQWITIDLFKTKVHCVDILRKGATAPVSYVFAWNNDNSLKDVSARYCPQWNTVTRKQRVDKEWLEKAIKKYLGKKNSRDIAEDRELEKIHMDKPLPTTINEFKNHPLYALERHLLKFEAIYPPNAVTLGFVRGEPIYPRDCIHTLHSREIWLKAARVVKPGEKPYKIVKARPKWDRHTSTVIKDQPLDIFGYWQTMDYEPPTAENGIVPRNAYGNVELFKPTMLPKKTVHLQLPSLNRVCKKLGIDCASAVIGFDFHQGACHPLYDGFVVCEEFKDQVIEAWEEDQQEQARRELEKIETRVYGNWKRLIRGLLIREKLKIKYNFGEVNIKEKTAPKRKK